ncbi:cysteine synthase A [Nostoc sp. NIES-4103]|nr:cysteine synthase A [Nostoc sp. NIES-4103]
MVEAAEKAGLIHPGKTILVEPTSDNTGIALFMMAAAKGYYIILTMPDTISQERPAMLRVHGAQIKLMPGVQGIEEASFGAIGSPLDARFDARFDAPSPKGRRYA